MATAVNKKIAFSIFLYGLISVGCSNDSTQAPNSINDKNVSDSAIEKSGSIKFSLVIREQYRNEVGIEEVSKILQSQGFTVTNSGRATVSGRASLEVFQRAFALTEAQISQLEASSAVSKNQMQIDPPESLSKYSRAIAVEPEAEYLNQ